MRNTTIILFATFLLFTVFNENVFAGNNSLLQEEHKKDIVVELFKLTDGIFEFSEDILTIGNKEKGTIEKQKFDILENLLSLGEDAMNFSWYIISMGEDEQEQKQNNYRQYPTRQQWENIEAMSFFMLIAEYIANNAVGDKGQFYNSYYRCE